MREFLFCFCAQRHHSKRSIRVVHPCVPWLRFKESTKTFLFYKNIHKGDKGVIGTPGDLPTQHVMFATTVAWPRSVLRTSFGLSAARTATPYEFAYGVRPDPQSTNQKLNKNHITQSKMPSFKIEEQQEMYKHTTDDTAPTLNNSKNIKQCSKTHTTTNVHTDKISTLLTFHF